MKQDMHNKPDFLFCFQTNPFHNCQSNAHLYNTVLFKQIHPISINNSLSICIAQFCPNKSISINSMSACIAQFCPNKSIPSVSIQCRMAQFCPNKSIPSASIQCPHNTCSVQTNPSHQYQLCVHLCSTVLSKQSHAIRIK